MFYRETNFKETSIGKIPKDWEVKKLKDVILEAKSGFACGKRDENGIIQLRMDSIETEGWINTEAYVKVPIPKNVEEYTVRPRDIIFNNTNSVDLIGKTAIFSGEFRECVYSNHLTRIRVNFDKAIPEWILYILIRKWQLGIFRALCHRHVGQAGINKGDIYNLKIPVPQLLEQQKIAEILSTVDNAIQKVDEVIAKTERLKKGLMQELLTKGIGHKEFNNTEIGRIPKDWEIVALKEIADVKGGKRVPKGDKLVDFKTPYPYIRVIDFKNGTIIKQDIKYLPPETYEKIKKYTISSDDVYISIAGTIGLVGLIPPELNGASLTENAAKLCNLKRVKKEFLMFVLNSTTIQTQIKAFTGKGTQPKFALFRIKKLKIPLPLIPEQQKIAQILSTVDKELELERNEKAKLERIKQGLMDLLLTGKIRVKVNENG